MCFFPHTYLGTSRGFSIEPMVFVYTSVQNNGVQSTKVGTPTNVLRMRFVLRHDAPTARQTLNA